MVILYESDGNVHRLKKIYLYMYIISLYLSVNVSSTAVLTGDAVNLIKQIETC